MTREDYIVRAIEQFARALGRVYAKLFNLTSAGRLDEAMAEVRNEIERLMGFGPELIDTLPTSQTLGLLRPTIRAEPARAGCLAILLKERAELFALQGNEPARTDSNTKALAILLEIHAVCGKFSLPQEPAALEALLSKAEAAELPREVQAQLLAYLEETQQ
jgi:hypothetical protein